MWTFSLCSKWNYCLAAGNVRFDFELLVPRLLVSFCNSSRFWYLDQLILVLIKNINNATKIEIIWYGQYITSCHHHSADYPHFPRMIQIYQCFDKVQRMQSKKISEFEAISPSSQRFNQQELNISKESSELLPSRLNAKDLLYPVTKTTFYRNRVQ